jgi:hypothetical protein
MERRGPVIVGVLIFITLGILAVWALTPGERPSVPSDLTEVTDPAQIPQFLHLDRMHIATSTNYVGHKIFIVYGTLKNVSDKPLRLVDVKMMFKDYGGKVLEEGVYRAFEPKQKPLEPGTEYQFSLNFENLPKTWNYRTPQTEIAKLAY